MSIIIPEKEGLLIKLIERYSINKKFSIYVQKELFPYMDYYRLNTKKITEDIERMSYKSIDFITFMINLKGEDAGIPYLSYKISPSGEISLNGILTAPSKRCYERQGLVLRYEAMTIRNPSKEYPDWVINYEGLKKWVNNLEPRFRFRVSNNKRSLGFSCLDGEPPDKKTVIRGFSYIFNDSNEITPSKPSESVFLNKKFLEQGYQYKIMKLSDFLNETKFLNWDSNPFQKN
jgi:hypothetical protein